MDARLTTFIKCKKLIRGFLVAVILSVIFVYYVLSRQQHTNYVRDPNLKCNYTAEEQKQLLHLAYDVHLILNQLNLEHWLMYGAIFGALRYGKPLPWDQDIDFGIRGEQFNSDKKAKMNAALTEKGIRVIDDLKESGALWCLRSGAKVDIFLFTESYIDGMMKRQGWESWVFFLHYRFWHSFPAELVKSPLPLSRFGFFNVSVPHGGYEITKYLYRNDWWKVVKPKRCHNK